MINGRVLITGITGMLGGKIVEYLIKTDEFINGDIKILGITRNIECAPNVLKNDVGIELIEGDISDKFFMDQFDNIDFIFHCAAVTNSREMITHPVEVADGIVLGTRNVLEIAKKCRVKGMIYFSSMEVYGVVEDIGRPRKEEELGSLDLNSPRCCYPMAKRMAEHYCFLYYKEYGVKVKIARLAQTFGAGVRKDDNRVYMQFAKSVITGNDVVLHTSGQSIGNYCGIADVIKATLLIVENGIDGEVYNVVNEKNTMSILEMANVVAQIIANGNIHVSVETKSNAETGYASDTQLKLSSEKLRKLGWNPTVSLVQMYQEVIDSING